MVWCGSTEAYQEPSDVHATVASFEQGLKDDDANISPSQIYCYAALQSDVPYANGAPNLTTDLDCMIELSKTRNVPIAGKDFKTGQTLMKTMLAPGFKARMLGMRGWYSTNILGNRDGEVLDDPENFKTKEVSKLGVLGGILQPEVYPDLYGNIDHVVRINYYPPRGDNKEGWDAIDIFGWLGYEMQIKVDFLCRDSILAAPIVLDLALFMDLAHRAGESGVQEWLSFYLKAPQAAGDSPGRAGPVHPADQAQEHPARVDGRAARHPLRSRLTPPAPPAPPFAAHTVATRLRDSLVGPLQPNRAANRVRGSDLIQSSVMTAVVMDGNACATRSSSDCGRRIEAAGSPAICLATVLVGDDGPSQRYVRMKHAKAAEAGLTHAMSTCRRRPPRQRSSRSCVNSSPTTRCTASSCSSRSPTVSTPNRSSTSSRRRRTSTA